jgi:DNA polymerase I-like protein with 3'-5' exonuclease and polymerase domains
MTEERQNFNFNQSRGLKMPSENRRFTPSENYVYCDIETNGLNPDTIWCAVCRYKGVNTIILNAEDFQAYRASIPNVKFVFHNGIGFDVPVLSKLWNIHFPKETVLDTVILSRLADPSRDGGHSLRAWGERLGFPKGDHEDWSQLTPEMITYCERDTEVTEAVHRALIEELDGFSQESIDLEHQVAWIIAQQERNGWKLDERKAHMLLAQFKEEMVEIETELQQIFPPIVTRRFSEKQFDKETGAPKELKPSVEVFNPGSRQQIAKRLADKGAVWKELTETGRPVVNESTLKDNESIPEAKAVLRYLLIQKRESQVRSWIEHCGLDGRVHGRVTTNGAVTGRMTHQSPNMAQVPANNAEYGIECRSCWIAERGYKIVGGDASGLELRMLAHFMNDEGYTNEILNGDIHTANQIAAGLQERNQAKTFIYAFL